MLVTAKKFIFHKFGVLVSVYIELQVTVFLCRNLGTFWCFKGFFLIWLLRFIFLEYILLHANCSFNLIFMVVSFILVFLPRTGINTCMSKLVKCVFIKTHETEWESVRVEQPNEGGIDKITQMRVNSRQLW